MKQRVEEVGKHALARWSTWSELSFDLKAPREPLAGFQLETTSSPSYLAILDFQVSSAMTFRLPAVSSSARLIWPAVRPGPAGEAAVASRGKSARLQSPLQLRDSKPFYGKAVGR
jgi:hypothetical protein